jgi:hydrogenase nickel incorporation protein HypA/HybF
MHELAIANSVAAVALRHARRRRVLSVELRVGHLRQVVPDALRFAWEMVTPETALAGSELQLVEVPARGRCRACGVESELDGFPLACPACGDLDVEVVAGEELSVESLDVEGGRACTAPR